MPSDDIKVQSAEKVFFLIFTLFFSPSFLWRWIGGFILIDARLPLSQRI